MSAENEGATAVSCPTKLPASSNIVWLFPMHDVRCQCRALHAMQNVIVGHYGARMQFQRETGADPDRNTQRRS